MKKFLKSIFTAFLTLPTTALAAPPVRCPDDAPCSELTVLITRISNTILLIVGVVAVLMLIIGGFQYITSAGNTETVGKAKNTILYAIIGILVTLLAYALVQYVITRMYAS